MKYIAYFLFIFLWSCTSTTVSQQSKKDVKSNKEGTIIVLNDSVMTEDENISNADPTLQRYRAEQDSLRAILLAKKDNEHLKNSFLQELYIRNFIAVDEGIIYFSFTFDLHGGGCPAPDCYITNISFDLKEEYPIRFPEKLKFTFHESGCMHEDVTTNGVFELVELNESAVNYYSPSHKSNLIISAQDFNYFNAVKPTQITFASADSILLGYSDNDDDYVEYYTSSYMFQSYEVYFDE